MIEWFLLYLLTWPAFVVLILVSLILEFNDKHVLAAFFVGVIGLVAWKMFEIPNSTMLWGAVVYIPIGLVWSVWRWRVHCKEVVRKANDYHRKMKNQHGWTPPTNVSKEGVEQLLNPKQNSDKLISWVIGWPVSAVERTLGDIVHMIRVMVTEWFGSVFNKISASALSELDSQIVRRDKHY